MAPSFSATCLIIQMEDLQVINMYRGPCYLGLVLFEAAVNSPQLLKGRRSFSTFKHFCWCFCSDSKLEFCRDDGWGFPLRNQSTCILLFRTPDDQPRVKSTLLCAHLWAATASLTQGESRRGTLASCLPRQTPLCRPTPPGPDHVPHRYHQRCSCCCCSRGLAWGLSLHQCSLVSLSVMDATVLCRQAAPSV